MPTKRTRNLNVINFHCNSLNPTIYNNNNVMKKSVNSKFGFLPYQKYNSIPNYSFSPNFLIVLYVQ